MKFLFVVLVATFLATAALAQITCNLNQKLRSSIDPEIEKDICFDGICRLLGECRLPKKCLHEVQPGFCDCGYVCAKKFEKKEENQNGGGGGAETSPAGEDGGK